MGYQDWASYSGLEAAANVYLRDPEIGLDQLRGYIDVPSVQVFVTARGVNNESWGEAIWQEVAILDRSLSTEFEILDGGTRRLSQVRPRMYTQLVNRRRTSATGADLICECFRFNKSVDNGGLAPMQRLFQIARVLSRATAAP